MHLLTKRNDQNIRLTDLQPGTGILSTANAIVNDAVQ